MLQGFKCAILHNDLLASMWWIRYYIDVGQNPHSSKRPERQESIARLKQGLQPWSG